METYQSSPTLPASGDTVDFRVEAGDAQGSALTFSWQTNVGTLGPATRGETTREVAWTAPACVAEGTTPTATVTVRNALGLSTGNSFTLQGGAPE